ncbi:hypothetical protein HGA88_04235 [Candidatus Roizmanbacteria bacterium]|nr:hypothetical protein [Candidatus Roizmanbacteria bacterium]
MKGKICIVLSLIFVLFVFTSKSVEARSGCCSHHGGVCGCTCCDGSSLSTKCAPYYPCGTASPSSTPFPLPTWTPTPRQIPTNTPVPSPTLTIAPTPMVQPTLEITTAPAVKSAQTSREKSKPKEFWTWFFAFFHF